MKVLTLVKYKGNYINCLIVFVQLIVLTVKLIHFNNVINNKEMCRIQEPCTL